MRAPWVDAGNDCDWAKAEAHEMTAIYYAVTDPIGDLKRRVSDTKLRNLTPGVYMAWNWPEFSGRSGGDVAEVMHSLVAKVEQGGVPVKVQFDIETHEPTFILECLTRWRALRPKQDTAGTMEGGQGGWMSQLFVEDITRLKIRLAPQLYNGAMDQVWDSLAFTRDLTKRGFPDALISPFYDAAHLPVGWDGFAFTQGRLP